MKRTQSVLGGFPLILAAAIFSALCTTTSPGQNSTTAGSDGVKTSTRVDVNTADLKTLETLPGVGPATAQKIIDGRPYRSLAELGKAKGLSEPRLNALKDHVTFSATTMATPAPLPSATATPNRSSTAATGTGNKADRTSGARSSTAKLAPGEKININTATALDLDRLPGIGPAKAQAIINYRIQNGNFKAIQDIEKVKGIKGGEFAKLKDHVKVSD